MGTGGAKIVIMAKRRIKETFNGGFFYFNIVIIGEDRAVERHFDLK